MEEQDTLAKSNIRKKLLYTRNSIPKTEIIDNSKIINNKVILTREYQIAQTIGVYYPIGSEVTTFDIISHAIEKKKEIALPKVMDSTKIQFFKVIEESFEKIKFKKGKYGIYENFMSNTYIDKFDLLIVPGIAFDIKGNRIGYGKGYYDRFLSFDRAKCIMGLAYETQIVYNISKNEHDIPVDMIITEQRIIRI